MAGPLGPGRAKDWETGERPRCLRHIHRYRVVASYAALWAWLSTVRKKDLSRLKSLMSPPAGNGKWAPLCLDRQQGASVAAVNCWSQVVFYACCLPTASFDQAKIDNTLYRTEHPLVHHGTR